LQGTASSVSRSARSRTLALSAAFVALAALTPLPGAAQSEACPAPSDIVGDLRGVAADIRYLADDALRGREVATPGARCAGDFLADRFRQADLEPVAGSYFQPFLIRSGAAVGADNRLSTPDATYTTENEWVPFGFSASTRVSAPLVYAGSGLSEPGQPTDSATLIDVSGRIAVVESGDPSAPNRSTVRSDPHFKATVAAGRGAGAVLVLLPEGESLPDPSEELRGPLSMPAAAVRGPAAERIRELARQGADLTIRTDVEILTEEARNVVGLLPGSDPELRDEWIGLGAHYDHLGLGGEGSLAPDEYGSIHNGADDNASGTAAIVEAARILRQGPALGRSVLFIGFTGEEKGLWGSSYYVQDPLHPLDRTVAMLNLDMVGRLEEGDLTVLGTGTAEEWESMVSTANSEQSSPLPVSYVPDGYGASDHSSFYSQGIPVLHFFTNTHADYHRPSDDFDKVDVPGTQRVAGLVAEVTRDLAGTAGSGAGRMAAAPAELTVIRDDNPHGGGGNGDPGGVQGYGPYLGTVPDMTPSEGGVRLTGVRGGSPAEEAGIREGDVVVEFAGREITDLYSYTYALQAHEPGDTVEIVVERNGERVSLTAILEER
ncbi:MAG: M28 family peptidase, partial [Gemmatimonadota bacterium]